MRVLLVLSTVLSVLVTQNTSYGVKNCTQYLLYQGATDYMYLQQSNNKTQVWVQKNDSYAIFAGELTDPLSFGWNNGVLVMTKVLAEGSIIYPLEFSGEVFLCPIVSAPSPPCPVTYKCKSTPVWIYPISVLGFVLLILLYGKLSGTQISRLAEWGIQLYTRIREQQGSPRIS